MTITPDTQDPPDFELTPPVFAETLHSHLSINQLALLCGIDRATVTKRLKDLAWRRGAKSAKLYDTTAALPLIYRVGDSAGDRLDPQQEKAQLDRERRRIVELDRQQKEGELVAIDTVKEEWLIILGIARSRLLAMPSRVAPDLRDQTDIRELEDTLTEAVHTVLEEMSGDVRDCAST